ncbi:MAG TPA: hypothetical protein DCY12_08325 [Candidatus Atribacteria bacterium]|nr:hypothetical protein [Candidatus Atribacteria bacterium]
MRKPTFPQLKPRYSQILVDIYSSTKGISSDFQCYPIFLPSSTDAPERGKKLNIESVLEKIPS